MKRWILILALALAAAPAAAQTANYSCTATGNGPEITANAGEQIVYSVSGTFVGTAAVQQFIGPDNVNGTWTTLASATTTASAAFRAEPSPGQGQARYRIRCTAYTSGTIVTQLTRALLGPIGLVNADQFCTGSIAPVTTSTSPSALSICPDGALWTWNASTQAWGSAGGAGGAAASSAHFVTTQAESGLSAESSLGALSTGLVKCTTASSVCTPSAVTTGTGIETALGVNVGSAGAPVLFNGAGGTPSSLTLTNATALPVGSITGLGTGVGTALAVNVGSAGAFTTFNGAHGTPSSITLTSATGLPISTGVSGLGTGVATALAVNVGSAGAPVTFNGAGGTPSSLTLTNATGLPDSGLALPRKIATNTLGSNANSISFTSIPGTYAALRLICQGRITEAAADDYVNVQFNGDTGSNYDHQFIRAQNSTVSGGATYAAASGRASEWPGTSASSSAQPGTLDLYIPNYAGTTFNKAGTSTGGDVFGTSGTSMSVITSFIHWRSTAAITQIDLIPAANQLATGTRCTLYGQP